jgi:hypothetical protein
VGPESTEEVAAPVPAAAVPDEDEDSYSEEDYANYTIEDSAQREQETAVEGEDIDEEKFYQA